MLYRAPGWTRTSHLRPRKPLLSSTELRGRAWGWRDSNPLRRCTCFTDKPDSPASAHPQGVVLSRAARGIRTPTGPGLGRPPLPLGYRGMVERGIAEPGIAEPSTGVEPVTPVWRTGMSPWTPRRPDGACPSSDSNGDLTGFDRVRYRLRQKDIVETRTPPVPGDGWAAFARLRAGYPPRMPP